MKVASRTEPRNVCGIQRPSDGRWWQSNLEHGSGWTDRIRQAWTLREARLEVRKLFELGYVRADDVRVVELGPSEQPR